MKKLKSLLIASIGIVALTASCNDDFLLKEPLGQIAGPSLNNADGVEGKLIAAYRTLSGQGMNGGGTWYYDIHGWIFGSIASDNAVKGTDAGDQPEHSFIEAYDFTTFNDHIKDKWRSVYWGMARANEVIDAVAEAAEGDDPVDSARAAVIIAEARFLRGFHALQAQLHFRNPAYVDEAAYDVNDVESSKVANSGPIWDQIIADFTAAAGALPATQAQVGRATSWAALAFLAKTHMHSGDAGLIAAAIPVMENIVNNGPFSLVDKYEDNHLVATRNNSESIFEIQYAISSGDDQNSNKGVGLAHPYISPWGCCGFWQATQDMVDVHHTNADGLPWLGGEWKTVHITNPDGANIGEPIDNPSVDPRLDHSVGRPGILYKNHHIMQVDYVRDLTYAGPYFSKKHVGEPEAFGVGGWGNLTANNYRIMRLSMVKLWLAEAYVEAGRLEDARAQVNDIRRRAANPAGFVPEAIQGATRTEFTTTSNPAANYNIGEYTAAWTDASVARTAVRMETRIEFAMEGHRFFDLQRWGVMGTVLNDYLARESKYRIYLQGKSFTSPKNQYYPIPQQAIDRSFVEGAATLTQDPNY
ncbi:RagB/SusD family nutrient uptake outer membrane protein [Flavobacteriaceae bacterium]|nr:RagB/SusD family nutrient uptake outer membrane protein [Flavobacteriaceae bacterium]MDB4267217.1 RagB/SusD family nutrient uptake outer membrane protein [Flavobacteriaceae bacterium]MDC0104138.1 RagB/SusD family nutrient uptake outer membrane protein [Flavobacteriaceae bacterium]MDC0486385.1 RagB/SusD family nutrient uptake outer membrane protein [Flavobacteriaceae bacterium]